MFFTILNYQVNAQSRRACTQGLQDMTATLAAAKGLSMRMDGQPLTGVARGTTDGCVHLRDYGVCLGSDGYWMAVKFSSPGRHMLAFAGTMSGFQQNVSYTLTVKQVEGAPAPSRAKSRTIPVLMDKGLNWPCSWQS